jgi:GxxExxY protein
MPLFFEHDFLDLFELTGFERGKITKFTGTNLFTMDINIITHKIIGSAMQVHNSLGSGFQELIYQRALAIELASNGLAFEREKEMPIYYRSEQIGLRRVDFFVEEVVMVELKALETLLDVHKAQAINYLEAYGIADGLLINFGGLSLDFKRVYNKKLIRPN